MSSNAPDRSETTLKAFTSSGGGPRATFPLVLASVAVAVLALHLDAVIHYSVGAFWVGVCLAALLSGLVGRIVTVTPEPKARLAIALTLPAVFGALIGMIVQSLVLAEVGTGWGNAVRDLGGLVDTTSPIPWIASGIVLGGVPALLVSVFLLVAARALRRIAGHDAGERFTVPFTGAAGVLAALGLLVVTRAEMAPLVVVAFLAAITLLVAWLVDGSRMRFLRDVFAGKDGAFEVVPAHAFAADPSLAPLVADAAGVGATSVLVRVASNPGSYRAAAAQPIALVADTVEASIQPLRSRRVAAAVMLGAMTVLALAASAAQGV
jgi:hypothetical protein